MLHWLQVSSSTAWTLNRTTNAEHEALMPFLESSYWIGSSDRPTSVVVRAQQAVPFGREWTFTTIFYFSTRLYYYILRNAERIIWCLRGAVCNSQYSFRETMSSALCKIVAMSIVFKPKNIFKPSVKITTYIKWAKNLRMWNHKNHQKFFETTSHIVLERCWLECYQPEWQKYLDFHIEDKTY